RVGIPPESRPRLTILDSRSVSLPTGAVGPVQRWVPLLPGSDERVPADAEDPTVYGDDALYPSEEPVRMGTIGALREQPFVELVFTPILHNPLRRSSVLYNQVPVRVDFGRVAVPAASAVGPD